MAGIAVGYPRAGSGAFWPGDIRQMSADAAGSVPSNSLAVGRTWLSFCNGPRPADGVAADLDRMHGRGPYPAAGKPAAGKRAAPGSGGI